VYAGRDVGRPYVVLGYVFRTTEGHKAGLEAFDESMFIVSHTSELMSELRQIALAKGADAIVGVELFPSLGGWGQTVGFSVGGLAVKYAGPATLPPSAVPEPAPPPPGNTDPPAPTEPTAPTAPTPTPTIEPDTDGPAPLPAPSDRGL
jgi:hypothetical protein